MIIQRDTCFELLKSGKGSAFKTFPQLGLMKAMELSSLTGIDYFLLQSHMDGAVAAMKKPKESKFGLTLKSLSPAFPTFSYFLFL